MKVTKIGIEPHKKQGNNQSGRNTGRTKTRSLHFLDKALQSCYLTENPANKLQRLNDKRNKETTDKQGYQNKNLDDNKLISE